MPNHVWNRIHMKGIADLPLYSEEDGKKSFDFNKIIPMPESLNMNSGSYEELAIEAVMRKLEKKSCFISPIPITVKKSANYESKLKSYAEGAFGEKPKTEEDICKDGLTYISNIINYGASTWYDWCCDNWDTKWNAYSFYVIDKDTIAFQTAWAPPEKIFAKLSEMYPDVEIAVRWANEDSGAGTGNAVYKGGEVIEGGDVEDNSNEAYELYIEMFGESSCLAKDENGNWYHKDCDNCNGCG